MFRVYGKPDCIYCTNAQKHIMKNFPNEEIDYIDISVVSAAKDFLVKQGFKRVPQIYHVLPNSTEDIYIGGFDDLERYTKDFYK